MDSDLVLYTYKCADCGCLAPCDSQMMAMRASGPNAKRAAPRGRWNGMAGLLTASARV